MFGDTRDAAVLLHLATVRSDDVLLVAAEPDQGVRRAAERLGVTHRDVGGSSVPDGAACFRVADDRSAGAGAITAEAGSRRIPVFATSRPAPSDVTPPDVPERLSCIPPATGPPVRG